MRRIPFGETPALIDSAVSMYSTSAAIILGWGAAYGYVAVYSLTLWNRRRTLREYRTFGLMSLSIVVQCVGGALLVDASDLAAGTTAMGFRITGAAFTLAFVHHAALQLAGIERPGLIRAGYAWATAYAVLSISGCGFIPGVAAPAPTWGLAGGRDYFDPALSVSSQVLLLCAWPLVVSTIDGAYRAARADRRVRPLLWALVTIAIGSTHDQLILAGSLRSYYIGEHTTLLALGAIGKLLIDRFSQTSTNLDLRTRELSQSYDELRYTEAALVKKEQLATVGELSGLIAEQVGDPLGAIKEVSSGLSRVDLDDAGRSVLLDGLDGEVDRLNRLVDNLLSYARPLQRQVGPVAIVEIVEEVLGGRVPEDAKIDVDVELEGTDTTLYADGDLLRIALSNIVDNAVQAMPEGGSLVVTSRPTVVAGATTLIVEVHDSGIGMSPQTKKKCRDPFFTTEPLGTGLGLAIVERVVALHSGTLTIDSAPGLGTVIQMQIPDRGHGSSVSSDETPTPAALKGSARAR